MGQNANQPPPLTDYNLWTSDVPLREAPELRTHDRFGDRVDEVDFHPAGHELMRMAVEQSGHNLPWIDPRPGGTWRGVSNSRATSEADYHRSTIYLPQ